MLISLNVKNFAIIDNIQLDFTNTRDKGLYVMTGETGAGKSLIIDAIGLLFGARASSNLIRYGEDKAIITGLFSDYNNQMINILSKYSITYDVNDYLIIQRTLYKSGKSICKINNEMVTLSQLNELSAYIGDIHSQNDSFGLINDKNYLNFISNDDVKKQLVAYQVSYNEYKNMKNDLEELKRKNDENIKKKDFLMYQVNELEKAHLSITEEQELKEKLKYLANFNKINDEIQSFRQIYDDENALGLIQSSLSSLEKLKEMDSRYQESYKTLEEAYYNIEDLCNNSLLYVNDGDVNSKDIDSINDRLGKYSDLKRKYKMDISEIVKYYETIKQDLYDVDNYDILLLKKEKELKSQYDKTFELAYAIRKSRMDYAKLLTENILENLNDLELPNTNFIIDFNKLDKKKVAFLPDGIDIVDFLVSFNKGEPVKPLYKVASGGELSRFMLALKTVLGDQLPLQIKIFDEIDSGISGKVAHSIALKIKKISNKSQVLCITHLPQVASVGDIQYKISKEIKENRTFTIIHKLNKDERIIEIASMISNGKVTNASEALAKELLNKDEM